MWCQSSGGCSAGEEGDLASDLEGTEVVGEHRAGADAGRPSTAHTEGVSRVATIVRQGDKFGWVQLTSLPVGVSRGRGVATEGFRFGA